ncbi:MAG: glutamate--tRNA ligase [Pseudomonadota bacterium]
MSDQVRVRFPPSPTGYLHIGGARTALFNWLFAQKSGGKMILRIEDTDAERSTQESIHGIIESLKWLGITWDEGPYFQSQFVGDHIAAAHKLLNSGHAYKCFCKKEELEDKRDEAKTVRTEKTRDLCLTLTPEQILEREQAGIPYVIRFKVPRDKGSIIFRDIVYGVIEKRYEDIEDFAIVRSNGQPLYVLANAVDDIRDGITHVIRGQDGLANTPKQILIYKALDEPVPAFAHMSLTLDPKKAKISKRKHGELVAVHFYRDRGFLPWAMVNFLVLLGWSTSDSREIFSKEELIEAFSLEGISRGNAILNIQQSDPRFFTDPKAININAHYIRTIPIEELEPYVKAELEKAGIWDPVYESEKHDWFLSTVDLIRSRYHLLTDFATFGRAYFADDFPIDPKALEKNVRKHPGLKEWFTLLADRFETIEGFATENIERVTRETVEQNGINPGVLMNGTRAAVTGQPVGPGFHEFLEAIGKKRVVDRLRRATALFD